MWTSQRHWDFPDTHRNPEQYLAIIGVQYLSDWINDLTKTQKDQMTF